MTLFCLGALWGALWVAVLLYGRELAQRFFRRRAALFYAASILRGGDVRAMKTYCSKQAIQAAIVRGQKGADTLWNSGRSW